MPLQIQIRTGKWRLGEKLVNTLSARSGGRGKLFGLLFLTQGRERLLNCLIYRMRSTAPYFFLHEPFDFRFEFHCHTFNLASSKVLCKLFREVLGGPWLSCCSFFVPIADYWGAVGRFLAILVRVLPAAVS